MVDMATLVGSIRRFGLEGPAYEVVGIAPHSSTGVPQMRIYVLESGDELDYPISELLRDPEAD